MSIKCSTFALANANKALYRGVEQLVARQAHNLEVIRSSRVSATNKAVTTLKEVSYRLFFRETLIYGFCL